MRAVAIGPKKLLRKSGMSANTAAAADTVRAIPTCGLSSRRRTETPRVALGCRRTAGVATPYALHYAGCLLLYGSDAGMDHEAYQKAAALSTMRDLSAINGSEG